MRDEGENINGDVDLLISDIQHNQSITRANGNGEQEDLEQLLKTGAFTKEMMMGQTMRDLGSTIKEANMAAGNHKQSLEDSAADDYNDDFNESQ